MAEKFTKRVEWAFEAEKLLDEDQRLWVDGRRALLAERKAVLCKLVEMYEKE